ncbi:MAB_1171c family putative transporter [Amycolatopsis sp. NPDC059021]|uniref:MAB_1171c family putative transporter n=1 Tax=Amycolatopsis sp. NPDC059021 TaxID=3346704 RepID=UPI00367356C7
MTSWLYGIQISLLVIGLLWKGAQLARRPEALPLRVIVATLAVAVAGWTINTINGRSGGPSTTRDNVLLWVGHTLNPVLVCYGVTFFYLVASRSGGRLRRSLWWHTGLLTVALLIGGTAALSGRSSLTHTHIIDLTSDLYCGVVLTAAVVIALRLAFTATVRVKVGLAIAALGAGTIAAGCFIQAIGVISRWRTGHGIGPITAIFGIAMLYGVQVFVIGALYPAAVTRLAALRAWLRHIREYRSLRPLWTALSEAFPEHTLRLPDDARWSRINPANVHRRHHRRLIEIRDGLVHLSPYLGTNPPTTPVDLAPAIQDALARHANGEPPTTATATPVAVPDLPDRQEEIRMLLALSSAYAQRTNQGV